MNVAFVIILVLIFPFMAIFIIGYIFKVFRAKNMLSLANEIKFSLLSKKDDSYISKFPSFNLFSKGRKKRVRNILTGQRDTFKISIFQYSYRESSGGEDDRVCAYTAIFFDSDKLSVPNFFLRPKKFIEFEKSKIIKIGSSRTFDKRYFLQGDAKEAIINLFTLDILRLFEEEKGWYIEVAGNKLLFYKIRYLAPRKLQLFLDKAQRIATIFSSI